MADAVTVNREEAKELSGLDVHDRASAIIAARTIRARGAGRVSVGLSDGRAVVTEDEEHWLPSYPVVVTDTTGAGDAFAAGLAVGLVEGRSFLNACRLGHAAAALATTVLGARASLPFRVQVDALLEDTMASSKQRAAARRNIKKAAKAAKRKRTVANLPKRTALGKEGAKAAARRRKSGS